MRILFLNHNVAWSGGTFFRAFHFARMLVRRGHAVTVVSTAATAKRRGFVSEREGVRVVEAPDVLPGSGRTGWDPWNTIWRRRFVGGERWDLVHAFDSRLAVIWPALTAARGGAALVMDWADWWGRGGTIEERAAGAGLRAVIRPVETFFEEHYRTRAAGSTVISAALEQRAIALGVPPASILRLPGGSDPEAVTPRDTAACRRSLGLDDAPLVGYLGTLLAKDAALLFETFEDLRRRRPDARLVLIGNPKVPVPEVSGILRTGFVKFEAMLDWLGACDLMLLPQRDSIANRARWPSKVNDYLAAGKPVVASAVGDIAEVFAGGAIGRSVAATPSALAAAAVDLIQDPAARARCGAAARALAEGALSWSALAARLDTWYHEVPLAGAAAAAKGQGTRT